MEYGSINVLTKSGENAYELWTLTLPREKIYKIRQEPSVIEGNIDRIFEEMPMADDSPEDVHNFVFPHGADLKLVPVKMNTWFREEHRYNGNCVCGTKEKIIVKLRQSLMQQGNNLRANAAFMNVDVLDTLQKVVDHNTDYYQSDFEYDRKMLKVAAGERGGNRHFLWLSRPCGTLCFPEQNVYIAQTSTQNSWFYYGGDQNERIKAFWIELQGMKDDQVMGNILEIDYQRNLDYVCTHSFTPTAVEVVFKNPNDCRIFYYDEFYQNMESIAQRYGNIERKQFLVDEPELFARTVVQGRGLFWGAEEPVTIDEYVKRLDYDRLYDYGYTADDVVLTGPQDAEKAVKHGLDCYVLHKDGLKEPISDREAYQQAIYAGKLFGMMAGERELLQYFKQEVMPLFTTAEMQAIYALALQEAMKNEPGGNGLLEKIIHKAECMLPEEHELQEQPEREAFSNDIIQ